MGEWYKEDLAFIHDVGHGDFALGSAPGILEILKRSKIREGLVVDLGCGSGLWAGELTKAGYRVFGIDISESMLDIARGRVPDAEFRVASLFEKEEDRERGTLTRRITSFRKVGEHYRRADEVHRLRLYKPTDVAEELRQVGFRVQTRRSYGRYRLPRAHAAFLARKPTWGSEN
jgi:SAM-dependent methyltransferase